MKLQRVIAHNLKWHRRLGLVAALGVVVLVVTGIALNHSPTLGLKDTQLRAPWLLSWYGIAPEEIEAYIADGNWYWRSGDNQLWRNDRALAQCENKLLGAVVMQQYDAVLCGNGLLLLAADGQLIETLTTATGLPSDVTAIGSAPEQLMLRTPEAVISFDPDTLAIAEPAMAEVIWIEAAPLPAGLASLAEAEAGGHISLETVLLDLHSGRLFGAFGVWVVDIIALLLLVLAITGLWSYFSLQKLKREAEAAQRARQRR